jgi:hypothetical protein
MATKIVRVEIGAVFGYLTVLADAPRVNFKRQLLCRCRCGSEKAVDQWHLRKGHVVSCGRCHRADHPIGFRHGLTRTKVHRAWAAMRSRCYNRRQKGWRLYGGRGITVCQRWNSFEAFLADMGTPPAGPYSIDRINNAKGYSPENCRWATPSQQNNNTRLTRYLTFRGQRRCLTEWSRLTGLTPMAIRLRIDRRGWTIRKALTTPLDHSRLPRNRQGNLPRILDRL